MESKHTPGPWSVQNGAVYGCNNPKHGSSPHVCALDNTPIRIASMDRDGPNKVHAPTERDANARLIAAAPDMLQALERMVAVYEYVTQIRHDDDALAQAIAAIAKAQGK